MPRETKEQRLAREAQEEQARMEEFTKAYPGRLMDALRRATFQGMEITVMTNDEFRVCGENDDGETEKYCLPHSVRYVEFVGMLDGLENYLQRGDTKKAEADRNAKIRVVAIGKLTPEEKNVLGL